jgi:hypothetical protein
MFLAVDRVAIVTEGNLVLDEDASVVETELPFDKVSRTVVRKLDADKDASMVEHELPF